MNNKKEVIAIRKNIKANTEEIITERIKSNGYITNISIKFYVGQELALQVSPYVLHKGDRREDLFTYPRGTDNYLSGDDDYFKYNINLEVEYDDEIKIHVKNTSEYYNYDVVVDLGIEYKGANDGE